MDRSVELKSLCRGQLVLLLLSRKHVHLDAAHLVVGLPDQVCRSQELVDEIRLCKVLNSQQFLLEALWYQLRVELFVVLHLLKCGVEVMLTRGISALCRSEWQTPDWTDQGIGGRSC